MRRSGFVVLGLLIVVAFAGGAFAWEWNQRGPGRPSVGRAVGRFRTSTTLAAPTHSLVPRSGVYLYHGTGSESLSFLGTRQEQGPTEPGTIIVQPNGCWVLRIDFNSFHDQTWRRCATKGKLLEMGGTTDQRFDFVTFKMSDHGKITCDPPIALVDTGAGRGATSPVHCTGHSQTTGATFMQDGVATVVGQERVAVGTANVTGIHVHEEMVLSGGQQGAVRVDLWLAPTDGLPLKEAHSIRVVSPAPPPLGHVTYTELGSWQLTSTTPRT